MIPSPSLLHRWWHRLAQRRRRALAGRAQEPARVAARGGRRQRELRSGIEPLEGRIAPASLLPGGKLFTYQDIDGDHVTLHFSKTIFAPGTSLDAALDLVFSFSTGDAHSGTEVAQQLQTIDLTRVALNSQGASLAKGLSITMTVEKGPNGDGHADIGYLNGTNIGLGSITLLGDLGRISAGAAETATGLQALKVISLGEKTNTQAGTASYTSSVVGSIGSFSAETMKGAYLVARASAAGVSNIGSIDISKTLSARFLDATGTNDGVIQASGNIGRISLGSALTAGQDALIGGKGLDAGSIKAGGNIGSVLIGGDVVGGLGGVSGSLSAGGTIGSLVLKGQLQGGEGDSSATLVAGRSFGTVQIGTGTGAAILGGVGEGSASVRTSDGDVTSLRLLGDLAGGTGAKSAQLLINGNLGRLQITGSVLGVTDSIGTGLELQDNASVVVEGRLGAVTIGGHLTGGVGNESGFLSAASMGAVNIGGTVQGGTGLASGSVLTTSGALSSLLIGHGLAGGAGDGSGAIATAGSIGSVRIGLLPNSTLAVQGGEGDSSGSIDSGGGIGTTLLLGTVQGGAGDLSGRVAAAGELGRVDLRGSLLGHATGLKSGSVEGETGIGTINILGDLKGVANRSGSVVSGGSLRSLSVGGQVSGGVGDFSGAIIAQGSVGEVRIGGGLLGGAGDNSGYVETGGPLGRLLVSAPTGSTTGVAVAGGAGDYSGAVHASGALASVQILGHVQGAGGEHSGSLTGSGRSGTITLGQLQGGAGAFSGSISVLDSYQASAFLQTLSAGEMTGGAGAYSGSLMAEGSVGVIRAKGLYAGTTAESGQIRTGLNAGNLGNVALLQINDFGHGAVGSTPARQGGSVLLTGALGQFTAGSVAEARVSAATIGTLTADALDGATIEALGSPQTSAGTDVALARLQVRGSVTGSTILAGYQNGEAVNGHAQIGAIIVGGGWASSDAVAGVRDVNGDGFGTADDRGLPVENTALVSRIASITIAGELSGSGTHGFTAVTVGALRYGKTTLALNAAPQQVFANLIPGLSVREVAAALPEPMAVG